ncbi:GNAT family N-acetyltransferase [Streptomyces sp. NPDC056144]|uniref:GNAT family N-acetyltransferase n=1 Tax=unclassified Streptomyces TaxID=2593676 RepID=UPI0035E0E45F
MIRFATPADLDAVTAVHAASAPTGPEGLARSRAGWAAAIEHGLALCAVLGDEVVGAAAWAERGDAVVLTRFHVSPAHRRKGMGRQLHTGCVDVWNADRFTHATAAVLGEDERALAFGAAQDWFPDPRAPRSGDRVVLRLTLAAAPE